MGKDIIAIYDNKQHCVVTVLPLNFSLPDIYGN